MKVDFKQGLNASAIFNGDFYMVETYSNALQTVDARLYPEGSIATLNVAQNPYSAIKRQPFG